MKKQILTTLALAALACSSQAAVLFSTGWDNPTSTNTGDAGMNGTNRAIYISGAGDNTPSPANFWTVGNATQVDLSSVKYITNGTNNVGSTSVTDNELVKGAVFTTGTDFAYEIGASNSNIRYATGGTPTSIWMPQSGNSAVNDIRFNVLFEIKPTFSFDNLNIAFNYGTAQTNGTWHNNTAAAQNGTADVDIYSVAGDGTLSLVNTVVFNSVSLAGSGPLASLTATDTDASLGAGNYLLSIALTGKTKTERYAIDNLVVNAVAVPEPTTWALLAGSLTALVRSSAAVGAANFQSKIENRQSTICIGG